ncbi:RrF2 family transcriptional regulator [Bacillus capparidis]|uniref:Rrf2 family protein n=1 Tax=Bacillus capparidis TaxID=1840411 RepID=A0ABS4CUJ5_9BACI|nr:Rrf2 family transcriptional regulator [Bacillus capparidis]MBP1081243.1 Rrf2 family protein [Bacillus capparidis]MED1095922.1 Rrf2 family transcriptional regulator [Bacillus capparidis]
MSYSLSFWQGISIIVYTAVKVEHGYTDFVPTRQLSESLDIPIPTAVKILQSLNRTGLTETREGAKGGMRLAKKPEEITLLDVFHAIEHDRPLFRTKMPTSLTNDFATMVIEKMTASLQQSEQSMKSSLNQVTIADLFR